METLTVTGTITGLKTITLDQPLDKVGRVMVLIRTEETRTSAKPEEDLSTWLSDLVTRRKAEGRGRKVIRKSKTSLVR